MERSQFGPFDRPGWVNPRPIQASRRLPARVLLMQAHVPDGWRYTPIKRIHQSCKMNNQVQRVDVLECLGLVTTIHHCLPPPSDSLFQRCHKIPRRLARGPPRLGENNGASGAAGFVALCHPCRPL